MTQVQIPQNRFLRCAYLLVHRYLRHRVGVQSAALAFYLLFMLFPFLIFISALLGSLQLDVAAILRELRGFLPQEIVAVAEMYLNHVSRYPSSRLLTFGLVFSVYFPLRVTNALMRAVRMPRGMDTATISTKLSRLSHSVTAILGAISSQTGRL